MVSHLTASFNCWAPAECFPSIGIRTSPCRSLARRKGVKQEDGYCFCRAWFCSLLGVMRVSLTRTFRNPGGFAAIICFIGGPLRMLYAARLRGGGAESGENVWAAADSAQSRSLDHPATSGAATASSPSPSELAVATEHRRVGRPTQRYRKHHAITGERRSRPIDKLSLAERLRERIRLQGPITFHDWMKRLSTTRLGVITSDRI